MASNIVNFLKLKEGTEKENGLHIPYQDEADVWTIGYGHTEKGVIGPNTPPITEAEAEAFLKKDIQWAEDTYDKTVSLQQTPNQRDAVVSLIFNVGPGSWGGSNARDYLNKGDIQNFQREAFDKDVGWTKVTDPTTGNLKLSKGLIDRRISERDLYNSDPTPIKSASLGDPEEPEPVAAIAPAPDIGVPPPAIVPKTIQQFRLPASLKFRSRVPASGDRPGVDTDVGIKAMGEEYNSVWSWTAYSHGYPGELTEKEESDYHSGVFHPLDANKGTIYQSEEELMEIATARSHRELNWMYDNLKRSADNRAIISKMGTWQDVWMSVVVGETDPLTFATVLFWPTMPAAVGARIASASAMGASSMGIPELGLHATQPNRTLEESMMYVVAGAVMGSMFGPFMRGKVPDPSSETKKAVHSLLVDGDSIVRGTTPDFVMPGGSAGAAKVGADARIPPGFRQDIDAQVLSGKMTRQDAAIALRNKELEWTRVKYPRTTKIVGFFSPSVRLATSRFLSARGIGENIVEDSLVRQANAYGHTTADYAVETIAASQIQPLRVAVNNTMRSNYEAYVGKRSMTRFSPENMQAKSRGILTYDDFKIEIGKASSQGDMHPNPHVQAAAKALRAEHKKLEKQLLDEGLIPHRMEEIEVEIPAHMRDVDESLAARKKKGGTEVVEPKTKKQMVPSGDAKIPHGDVSYMPRVWNQKKILERFTEFREILIRNITKNMDADDLEKFWDPKHQIDFNAALDETIRSILGRPLSRMDKNLVPQTRFLKGRKLKIPTKEVQEFLDLDPGTIWYTYYRDMIPRLEMQRKFGSYDLSDQLLALDKEVSALLKAETDPKILTRINKDYKAARRDMLAMRDMVLNRYGNPNDPTSWLVGVGRGMRTWNAVTSLGGMMLAAIPDIGIISARMGMDKTIKGAADLGKRIQKENYSRAFLKRIGGALDATLNNRHQAMMMMDDAVGAHKATDDLVRNFSTLTGMAHWNAGMQNIVGLAIIDDLGGMVLRNANPSAKQMKRMAQVYNIDSRMWSRIKEQWGKHGTMDGGLRVPDLHNWTDREAARTLQASFLKEMRTAVVYPGMGDLPLASRSEIGKLVFQFKSFPLAATSRFMLSTLHNANLNPVNSAASILGVLMPLALVSYYVKSLAAGKEPSTEWNVLVREAIDRSGLFGIYSDLNAITEKMTRGQVGLMRALGGEPLSRRASQSVIGDILGPSFGKFGDAAASVGAVADMIAGEDISEGDIRRMRRLVPYQNMFYIRSPLNQAETSIYEAIK